MSWTEYYIPPDVQLWQGRSDAPPLSYFFQVMQCIDLTKNKKIHCANTTIVFGLIGFCCDEGIRRNLGRIGAAEGPLAIRNSLAKLPVPQRAFACFDVGNIVCVNGNLEGAQQTLANVVALLLEKNITPIVLGGGHELAWGHYQGITKTFPQKQLGIINFDAHFDMRPIAPDNRGNSGTPFLQMALATQVDSRRFDYNCVGIQSMGNITFLFKTAEEYQVKILLADDIQQGKTEKNMQFFDRVFSQNDMVYLSLCLDVFAAAYAPGVSAPQALGIPPWLLMPWFQYVATSGKVISYDVAELSPKYDIDAHTARLAASFVYQIIYHHTK